MGEKLPVRIIGSAEGLEDEAEERLRRTAEKHKGIQPPIIEITATITHQQGEKPYQLSARAPTETEQFIAKSEGKTLPEALDELVENLDKAFGHVPHPEGTPRKWAVFKR